MVLLDRELGVTTPLLPLYGEKVSINAWSLFSTQS